MNTFDKLLRLLTIITAVVTVFLSVQALLDNGLSAWVFISTVVFIAVLIISLVATYKKGNVEFFGLIGSMLGGLTIG
ncbi:DoxX family protein, partial [Vibrio sp. 10N.222.55.E8]